MTTIPSAKPHAPPGSIEFEFTDLSNARRALDELPAGVDSVATMQPNYWEQRRRRPTASDRALAGSTIDWLLMLPATLRPRALCDRYPRAANAIAAAWHGTERLAVLDGLLYDNRGRRRGFPPEVQQEIEALRLANANRAAPGNEAA